MVLIEQTADRHAAQVDVPCAAPPGRLRRFALVGTLGYGVNLACFAALVHLAGTPALAAASASFAIALAHSYLLNRAWRLTDAHGSVPGQGLRFAVVSLVALGANLAVLRVLLSAGLSPLVAQTFAALVSLPMNLAGNRFGSFERAATTATGVVSAPAAARGHVFLLERVAGWRTILQWWAISRATVLATALVVQYLRWPRASWSTPTAHQPFALLGAWDGHWYRMIAARGYLVIPDHQSDTAFFPFFPLLLRAGRLLGLSLNATGLLVANACFLVGLLALFELNRLWLDDAAARRASIYVAIFPAGYVFSMVYPESVVFAAIALTGVLAARGRWTWAALAAALATLTRPEALMLVLPLGALAARSWPSIDARTRVSAVTAVAAAPAALAGMAAYDWRTFGDPLAFGSAQRAWGRTFSLDGAQRAVVELAHSPGSENVWLFRDAAFCVLYLVVLVLALRAGVPRSWVVASALIVVLPVWSGSFTSDSRFGLLALPVYAGLACLARRRPVDVGLRTLSLLLLIAGTATLFLRWP